MMNKTETYQNALNALEALQGFTKQEFPVGTKVKSKRGRGEASFVVDGYPTPLSIELAQSVIGISKNGKIQTLNLATVTLDNTPDTVQETV